MGVHELSVRGDLAALRTEMLTAWSARFVGPWADATIPGVVVDEFLVSLLTGDTAGLCDAAQALGILRAHEGRQPSTLVEDLIALRTTLWGRLLANGGAPDPGYLLLLQQRAMETVDAALRASVEAFMMESQRVLARRATRDPLTGLLNRSAFDEALSHELAVRLKPPSVLFVDLDGFKQINDSLGHLAGDVVLFAVAALMTDVCRTGDVVGRLGGDEFALLLPATEPDLAAKVAQRLLSAASGSEQMKPLGGDRVGMSIGLAWMPPPATLDDLIHAADQAMYAAKRAGGSRVVRSVGRSRTC
jgi:diguanylate cyclase (GGDEF)-like protein